jgi:DNA polymerase-3 subunit delta'
VIDEAPFPPPPIKNPDLLGHGAAEELVIKAWQAGRFPHAWLIAGPKGVGKATFAYRIARWVLAGGADAGGGLFADAPATLAMGPEHGVFRRVASGGHADFRALEKPEDKTVIPVEAVRTLMGFIHRTASEGAWKAIVIDSADELNRNGANAILKVLEEPPPKTVFLLVSHSPGRLLPTIRSRCRTVTLRSLDDGVLRELVGRYAPDLPGPDADALVRISDGSIGRALDYAAAGGIDLFRGTMTLLSNPARLPADQLYGLADMLSAKGAERNYDAFRALLDWWMKRAIRSRATGIAPPPAVPEETAALERWAAMGGLETCMGLWEKLTGLLAQSDNPANLDKRQLVVSAFHEIQRVAARGP